MGDNAPISQRVKALEPGAFLECLQLCFEQLLLPIDRAAMVYRFLDDHIHEELSRLMAKSQETAGHDMGVSERAGESEGTGGGDERRSGGPLDDKIANSDSTRHEERQQDVGASTIDVGSGMGVEKSSAYGGVPPPPPLPPPPAPLQGGGWQATNSLHQGSGCGSARIPVVIQAGSADADTNTTSATTTATTIASPSRKFRDFLNKRRMETTPAATHAAKAASFSDEDQIKVSKWIA